jgi:hypothetical protein
MLVVNQECIGFIVINKTSVDFHNGSFANFFSNNEVNFFTSLLLKILVSFFLLFFGYFDTDNQKNNHSLKGILKIFFKLWFKKAPY